MPRPDLTLGALTLLLRHQLAGDPRAAHQAADLLARIAEGTDAETSDLCTRMSDRLRQGHGA